MNIVYFSGRLARDAETRITQTGKKVVSFTVASNEKVGDREITDFQNIVAWNAVADAADGLKKGASVCVFGKLSNRSYTDKTGQKRYVTEINAKEIYTSAYQHGEGVKKYGGESGGDFSKFGRPAMSNEEIPF